MPAAERRGAYVNTSCLVAVVLGEPNAATLRARLSDYDVLFASGLVEAELRAVLRREGLDIETLDVRQRAVAKKLGFG